MKEENKDIDLSIIIPIYKEKNNLTNLISKIKEEINTLKHEIIFVDDNSNDGTYELFIELKKKFNNIDLIVRNLDSKDLSKSCILGFEKAKHENILVMDGDFQHDPIYIKALVEKYKNHKCDVVVGTRNLITQKNEGIGFIRKLASQFLIIIIDIFLGKKTSDPMSGFFIFRKKIFDENKKKLYGKGYKILADLIYTNKSEIKILDVDIKFKRRVDGESKMNYKVLFYLVIFIIKKFIYRLVKV